MRASLFSFLLCAGLLPAQSTLIQNATVIDGRGAPPRTADVLISGGRIQAIGPDLAAPGAAKIEARGKTLIPGLFDLHTHVESATVGDSGQDWGKNLKAYLLSGVTTVADFGTYGEAFPTLRGLTSRGTWPSPRLHLASRITTPGGHCLEIGRGEIFTAEVLTPREGQAAVRRALKYKPDVIKVFTDGWRYGAAPDMTSMQEDTLRAIVKTAHEAGLPVLTHTVTVAKGKIAARAGVDAIMHGLQDEVLDAELIELMWNNGTAYGPTATVYEPRATVVDPFLERVLNAASLESLRRRPAFAEPDPRRVRKFEILQRNTRALYNAGIPLVAGTDSGISGTHHGWATLREIKLMVSAGVSPVDAIRAATLNAAKVLRVDKERGSIETGKLADLVLINGMPHRQIDDLQQVERVWLGGVEQNLPKLIQAIDNSEPTPLASIPAPALLDDFDRANGRSRLDTRWVNTYEGGRDLSRVLFQRIPRTGTNYALSVQAQMSEASQPRVRMNFPLRPGGIEPMDLTAWKFLEFDARGDGQPYRLLLSRRSSKEPGSAEFSAGPRWKKVRIPLAAMNCPCSDATALVFELARSAGLLTWLEIDNLRVAQ